MKKLLIVLACVAATVMVSGQGTVDVRSKAGVSPNNVDAPVFDVDGITKLSGAGYLAQVLAGPTAGSLAPIGASYPFRTGSGAGYYDYASTGAQVAIPTVTPGGTAFVQVVAWEAAAGSFATAKASTNFKWGQSGIITAVTGNPGAAPPTTPPLMVGLTGFSLGMNTAVPEPSTLALGLLGAATLLLRRRK